MGNVWNGDGRMKVLIYTPENEVEGEVGIICSMLDAGADFLYIRKPHLDDFSLVDYVERFDPKYYPKIITTSLIITKEFNLGGYHFTRDIVRKNEKYNDKVSEWLHSNNKISSMSAHSIDEIKKYDASFSHMIVSPIFKSISKENHQHDWNYYELQSLLYDSSFKTTFFAVGGVDENNILEINSMQFDGIGLLGALWKEPENALNKFSKILDKIQDNNKTND
jgi:thiamine-phosphate pyrophosphorylase